MRTPWKIPFYDQCAAPYVVQRLKAKSNLVCKLDLVVPSQLSLDFVQRSAVFLGAPHDIDGDLFDADADEALQD